MKSLQRGLARRGMRIKQQQQEPLFLTEKLKISKNFQKIGTFCEKKRLYR
jgi:hypothetical protein